MQIRDLMTDDTEQFNRLMMGVHEHHVKNRPDIYNKIEKSDSSMVWDFNKPALEFYKSLGMTVQSCIMEQKLRIPGKE